MEMEAFGIADNVMTVDSWQGREKLLVGNGSRSLFQVRDPSQK
jgi:hypothetical protein